MIFDPRRLLVVHTAFLGDIVLMLPLLQELRNRFPDSFICALVNTPAAEVLRNHPAVDEIIRFDKRGDDRGLRGIVRIAGIVRSHRFSAAFVPHRSLRSAMLVRLAGIPRRIGFSTSSGKFLLTDSVPYRKNRHEIDRNLSLLSAVGMSEPAEPPLPALYPDEDDIRFVEKMIEQKFEREGRRPLIGIAPGSIWATKRWPEERYVALATLLIEKGFQIALVGGPEDSVLCNRMAHSSRREEILNAAGRLTFLQSAELIRRCKVLVTNDSAPMHVGVASGTPVVAIYGATIPEFGFAPRGRNDVVLETRNLLCRPCSIHGGDRCPIGTFECMLKIRPEQALEVLLGILEAVRSASRINTERKNA